MVRSAILSPASADSRAAGKSPSSASVQARWLRARTAGGARAADELRQVQTALAEAEAARKLSEARAGELDQQLRTAQERERRLAELRADAPDPEEVYERLFDLETQYQAATMAAARVPDLEARVAELQARLAAK